MRDLKGSSSSSVSAVSSSSSRSTSLASSGAVTTSSCSTSRPLSRETVMLGTVVLDNTHTYLHRDEDGDIALVTYPGASLSLSAVARCAGCLRMPTASLMSMAVWRAV